MPLTFDTIATTLSGLQYAEAPDDGRNLASVAMILAERPNGLQLLFVERANDARDPWSGNLAFPGGRVEPGETLRQAAERETREETGIDLEPARLLGRVPDIVGAHLPVRVACFVYGFGDIPLEVTLNYESRDSFWVNLHDLADRQRHIISDVRFSDGQFNTPAIRLPQPGKPLLWGITYRLVMRFLELHGLH
jgi:8-oxo-dGTP pyrophosphatase MutT (NUDIX family)